MFGRLEYKYSRSASAKMFESCKIGIMRKLLAILLCRAAFSSDQNPDVKHFSVGVVFVLIVLF